MRLPDWSERLSKELMDARKRPWKWGDHDCVMLSAVKCVEAMTGESYESRRSKYQYSDVRGALSLLTNGSLREIIESEFGKPVPWTQCRRGDIVLCRTESDKTFADILTIHDGSQLLAANGVGIRRVPMELAITGWRI